MIGIHDITKQINGKLFFNNESKQVDNISFKKYIILINFLSVFNLHNIIIEVNIHRISNMVHLWHFFILVRKAF